MSPQDTSLTFSLHLVFCFQPKSVALTYWFGLKGALLPAVGFPTWQHHSALTPVESKAGTFFPIRCSRHLTTAMITDFKAQAMRDDSCVHSMHCIPSSISLCLISLSCSFFSGLRSLASRPRTVVTEKWSNWPSWPGCCPLRKTSPPNWTKHPSYASPLTSFGWNPSCSKVGDRVKLLKFILWVGIMESSSKTSVPWLCAPSSVRGLLLLARNVLWTLVRFWVGNLF